MKRSGFGVLEIQGDIVNGKFNGKIDLFHKEEQFELLQTLVMKNGMVLILSDVPFVDESMFELWNYGSSCEIEKSVNEHQYILAKLNYGVEEMYRAEQIFDLIEKHESTEDYIKIIELISKTTYSPIVIGFLNTSNGKVETFFEIICRSSLYNKIILNLCCGNSTFSHVGKAYFENCFFFEINIEIGSVFGDFLKKISSQKLGEQTKNYLTQSIQRLCSKCCVSFKSQKEALQKMKLLSSFWKKINGEEKDRFVQKQTKDILCSLQHFIEVYELPMSLMVNAWNEIENIWNTVDETLDLVKPFFVIMMASYSRKYFEQVEWILEFCEENLGLQKKYESRECECCVKTIVTLCKMILIDGSRPLNEILNRSVGNLWKTEDPIMLFDRVKSLENCLNPSIPLSDLDNFSVGKVRIVNQRTVLNSISKGNIDLFHLILLDNNPILKEYLMDFALNVKFPWGRTCLEENGTNQPNIVLSEKTIRCLLFYLMYGLGHLDTFKRDDSMLKVFLQFLKNLLQRDDIKMNSLNEKSKENAMILKKYFKIKKDIQCGLYYFHGVLLNKINNVNFIKDELIGIYELFINCENAQVNEMMKENKEHIAEIFKHLNDQKELENYALKFLGEICVKTEDTSVIQIGKSEEYIKKLILKSKDNLINYFNKIDENELLIGKELGRGVYAVVKSGYYKGNKVAIKMFSESSYQFRSEDFLQEIAIMSLLHHENIIKTFGATVNMKATEESTFYIISELATNGSLEDLISKKEVRDDMKLKIVLEIAKGLKYLHEMQIIHRDLKPANILIGDEFTVKITDFGLSAFANEKELDIVMGSYKWMSPERFLKKKYGKPADVYAFGIIAWQVFELKEPFENYISIEDLQNAVCNSNERPSLTNIPINIKNVLSSCWDKKPKKRPNFVSIIKELLMQSID